MCCLVQLYRWSKGEISGKEAAINCGEHAVAAIASTGGIVAGGAIVLAAGCTIPGVGVGIGLLLAVAFGIAARYGYRYLTQPQLEEEKEEESRKNAINAAAQALGITVEQGPKHDDFHIAKLKFRRKL